MSADIFGTSPRIRATKGLVAADIRNSATPPDEIRLVGPSSGPNPSGFREAAVVRVVNDEERSSTEKVDEFVRELVQGLESRLRRAGVEPGLISEATSLALIRLAQRIDATIDRYPTGDVYAQAIWKSVLIDTLRTEGAQRGSGFSGRRRIVRLSELGGHEIGISESVNVEERLLLRTALDQLTSQERTDLCRFVVAGFNLCEISKMNGEAHTTVGRRVRKAAARARRTLEPL